MDVLVDLDSPTLTIYRVGCFKIYHGVPYSIGANTKAISSLVGGMQFADRTLHIGFISFAHYWVHFGLRIVFFFHFRASLIRTSATPGPPCMLRSDPANGSLRSKKWRILVSEDLRSNFDLYKWHAQNWMKMLKLWEAFWFIFMGAGDPCIGFCNGLPWM